MPGRVVMSSGMHQNVQSQVRRILSESQEKFANGIAKAVTLPMTTLNNTTTFAVTTPLNGLREWTLTVTLVENSSPIGASPDHNIVTKD